MSKPNSERAKLRRAVKASIRRETWERATEAARRAAQPKPPTKAPMDPATWNRLMRNYYLCGRCGWEGQRDPAAKKERTIGDKKVRIHECPRCQRWLKRMPSAPTRRAKATGGY
jgi:hypothetical protein